MFKVGDVIISEMGNKYKILKKYYELNHSYDLQTADKMYTYHCIGANPKFGWKLIKRENKNTYPAWF